MDKIVSISTNVNSDRELRIQLPADFPTGQVDVTVTSSVAKQIPKTLGDLLNSEFFGMWRDRGDIEDSVEFARQLREKAWKRSA